MEEAVSRRLVEELGIECPLKFLYKFKYHAQYGAVGAEHEYCWVYYGHYDGEVDVNEHEITAWRYLDIASLESEVAASPENFTPWLKMEWAQITNSYLDDILQSSLEKP